MKLSEFSLQNSRDEAFALCQSLLALGVPDQEVEMTSKPFRMGKGHDTTYNTGTDASLSKECPDFCGHIKNPIGWGTNLISIKGDKASLVTYATGKANYVFPSGHLSIMISWTTGGHLVAERQPKYNSSSTILIFEPWQLASNPKTDKKWENTLQQAWTRKKQMRIFFCFKLPHFTYGGTQANANTSPAKNWTN